MTISPSPTKPPKLFSSAPHRIGYTILASFSFLTCIVLAVTYFSWKELKKNQTLLTTYSYVSQPHVQQSTIQLAVKNLRETVNLSGTMHYNKGNLAVRTFLKEDMETLASMFDSPPQELSKTLAMCTTVSADLIAALQYEDTVIHQLERLEQSLYRLIHEASLLNLSPEVALSPAEEEHIKPFIESLQILLSSLLLPAREDKELLTRSLKTLRTTLNKAREESLFLPPHAQKAWSKLIVSATTIIFTQSGYADTLLNVYNAHAQVISAQRKMLRQLHLLETLVPTSQATPMPSPQEVSQEVDDNIHIFSRFFILATIATLFISLLTFTFYYHVFFNRLTHIKNSLQKPAEGAPSPGKYKDEISDLAYAITRYTEEAKLSIQRAESASQTKSDFLDNINHEIRTPLNAIVGFSRMANETDLTEIQRSYLEKINQATNYLLGIMNVMLNFSKLETEATVIEVSPFNLIETIENATSFAQSKALSKGLTFELLIDPSLPTVVEGDALRVGQILNNLAINAIKYTHLGGVRIMAECLNMQNDRVNVAFSVSDDGIGMTQEQIAAFLPESTGAPAQPSSPNVSVTGLGLSVSASLCTLLGGTLSVKSEPARGSLFSFTLPFKVVSQEEDSTTNAGIPDLSGFSILLAEDNPINQEIALSLLEKTQARVTIAANGFEATDLAQEHHFDLILMDIQMPMMDGIAATKSILEYHNGHKVPPIIAMTANAMDKDKQKSLEAGMKDYITKPIEPSIFYEMLRKWCAKAI